MDLQPTNVFDSLAEIAAVYSPKTVNSINDYDVKIARTDGDYVWHTHDGTDEFFFVLDGHFAVSWRDADGEHTAELRKGDTFVVPKGVEHRPTSRGGSIMMFEPRGTVSTGDAAADELPDHIRPSTGR